MSEVVNDPRYVGSGASYTSVSEEQYLHGIEASLRKELTPERGLPNDYNERRLLDALQESTREVSQLDGRMRANEYRNPDLDGTPILPREELLKGMALDAIGERAAVPGITENDFAILPPLSTPQNPNGASPPRKR